MCLNKQIIDPALYNIAQANQYTFTFTFTFTFRATYSPTPR